MITQTTSLLPGTTPLQYRWRVCDTNLTSGSPEAQYQRQKIIQNTVRVAASLYTMNLGSLSAYQSAAANPDKVCWNQMSDRAVEHVQPNATASGSTYGGNSRRRSLFRLRPGAMSPGGKGVDIKHNSYDRRLNRLKGRAVLKNGVVPPTFGQPIPFNPAFPVYGGKTVKTGIVTECHCFPNPYLPQTYVNPTQEAIYEVVYHYSPGQPVYVINTGVGSHPTQFKYNLGTIVSAINATLYAVQLSNGTRQNYTVLQLLPYNPSSSSPSPPLLPEEQEPALFYDVSQYLKTNEHVCPRSPEIETVIQQDINALLRY